MEGSFNQEKTKLARVECDRILRSYRAMNDVLFRQGHMEELLAKIVRLMKLLCERRCMQLGPQYLRFPTRVSDCFYITTT